MTKNLPTAPLGVRISCAICLGIAVATMAAPLAVGIKIVVLIIAAAAGLLLTFNHPYRREVRKEVESRGTPYKTSVAQVMPLFPLWLALMILPAIRLSSIGAQWGLFAVALLAASIYTYFVFPQIDGTAHIKPRSR